MFYGREEHLDRFAALWRKKVPSFVVCRGRRRVGKSTLVERFAKASGARFVKIEGLAPDEGMTNRKQLDNFGERLARISGRKVGRVESWEDAFEKLNAILDDSGRTVVLLDEISWMGGYDKTFAAKLKVAWDNLFHARQGLVVFVCGSVSAWIHKNILKSRGFVGRISLDTVVTELPLRECVKFWGKKALRVPVRDILDVLSVTGGVPRYLEEVDPSLSADENIRRMCFLPDGYLFREFGELFNDVISGRAPVKRAILNELVNGPRSGVELAQKLGIERNGHLTEVLDELEISGFLAKENGLNPETGKRCRVDRYRIRDNYTRFFLRYIAPRANEIRQGAFESFSVDALPGWEAVMGLQFENLVINNFRELMPLVGLGNKLFLSAAPYRAVRPSTGGGCQVDFLIQTAHALYVIEIKRKSRIGGDVEEEVRQKISRLPRRKDAAVRAVLVYDGELAPSVEASDFFDHVVSVKSLLGLA